jgi:hypothetical protein
MRRRIEGQLRQSNPYNAEEWNEVQEAWEGWIERTADEIVLHEIVIMPRARQAD